MRIRASRDEGSGAGSEVASFEELSAVAGRYRKELSVTGRNFVDRLLVTLEALTAELVERRSGEGWSSRISVEGSLSANGLGFAWPEELAPGTTIDLEFLLEDTGASVPFSVQARVVRSQSLPGGASWQLGVEFMELQHATQQRLVRLLLDRQRVDLRARSQE